MCIVSRSKWRYAQGRTNHSFQFPRRYCGVNIAMCHLVHSFPHKCTILLQLSFCLTALHFTPIFPSTNKNLSLRYAPWRNTLVPWTRKMVCMEISAIQLPAMKRKLHGLLCRCFYVLRRLIRAFSFLNRRRISVASTCDWFVFTRTWKRKAKKKSHLTIADKFCLNFML